MAKDATLVVDSTTIKRESNSIDDMLTGLTLNLKTKSYNTTTLAYDTLPLDVARGCFHEYGSPGCAGASGHQRKK